jgi:hypothetical protein
MHSVEYVECQISAETALGGLEAGKKREEGDSD